ncbi:MAG: glycosyltransferase [Anaerolineales bacterium]|nr:glycosyltransferase [Anaerolineales bacterium]
MDFVVFAPNPWHDIWRNRQQIFSRLAVKHRVFYIEPARTSLSDWRRGWVVLHDLRRPAVIQERPNLWLYRVPAILPSRDTGGRFDHVSDRLLATHLRRTLSGLGFLSSDINRSPLTINQLPILWLYRPTNWRWAANTIPHRLLVYHITDDYTAFGHLSAAERDHLATDERDLLAAADLTIVTAPRLLELKRTYARRIELVPNGVDFEAFQRAAANPRKLPQLQHLADQFPLIGYSGHISSRLDLPLLREIALARPNWQFVFAGSEDPRGCEAELTALKAQPNVHFLGVLPVEDVPHFIAACDVCLIPYRVNDETRAISSLKLYEYLAAGKPVVSARVPAAVEYADVVEIADGTVDSWLLSLASALGSQQDGEAATARQTVALANTWDARVQQIETLMADAQRNTA